MDFPEGVIGKPVKIHTLALVVPDHRTYMHVPLLISTNTLDPLYVKCTSIQDEHDKHQTKNSQCFKKNQQNGQLGTVKLQSKKSINICAGERVALNGYVRHVPVVTNMTLLVEPPPSSLLAGLLFCSYVMTSPSAPSFKVPVLVKNETAHDIRVSGGHNIAWLSSPRAVSFLPAHDPKVTTSEPPQTPSFSMCNSMHVSDSGKLTFDFADSLLSEFSVTHFCTR